MERTERSKPKPSAPLTFMNSPAELERLLVHPDSRPAKDITAERPTTREAEAADGNLSGHPKKQTHSPAAPHPTREKNLKPLHTPVSQPGR